MNQKLAVRLLEKRGHTVVVANNGKEAIELLFGVDDEATKQPSCFQFDLVFMDVQMPGMDGWEATEIIREREKLSHRHLPIIAMTAYAMKGDRERCFAVGMDGYLSKPIRPDELFAAVENLAFNARQAPSNTASGGKLKQLLNWDQALRNVGGDEELLRELAVVFLQECPRWLADLREGVDRMNRIKINGAAHPLNSSLGTFGATGAQAFALELENMARQNDLADGPDMLKQLETELMRVLPALNDFATRSGFVK